MTSLLHTLSEVAVEKPSLVLMQGRDYWRIEELIAQARRDEKKKGYEHLKFDAFSWSRTPGSNKIVVWHYRQPIFREPGTED